MEKEEEQAFIGKVTDLSKFKELDGIKVYCEIKAESCWYITGRARPDINLLDLNEYDFVISIEKPCKVYPV